MANRRYETLVVMHPDLGEPGGKELAAKIRGIIESQEGSSILQVLEWGQRELAYLIEKQRRGIYFLFEFLRELVGILILVQLDVGLYVFQRVRRKTPNFRLDDVGWRSI